MAKAPTYRSMWSIYAKQWDKMIIKPERLNEFKKIAKARISEKPKYIEVEKATGVPWAMVAVIDQRESGAKGGVLHNGEMIVGTGRKTKLVPVGRGPFKTWLEAAIDALTMPGKAWDKVIDWRLEKVIYRLESFNGWGYYWHGVPSAYVWSGSNIYKSGKYIFDGPQGWRANVVDIQLGCAPLLLSMMQLDTSIQFIRED